MLDNAVTWFGITIENALAERVKVGMGDNIKYEPKYSLARLLLPEFKLPRPDPVKNSDNPFASFLPLIGKRGTGVKRYMYVPPQKEVA